MKNKILGGIGILWGGGLVVKWTLDGFPVSFSSPYRLGEFGAVVFGFLLLFAGIHTLRKDYR